MITTSSRMIAFMEVPFKELAALSLQLEAVKPRAKTPCGLAQSPENHTQSGPEHLDFKARHEAEVLAATCGQRLVSIKRRGSYQNIPDIRVPGQNVTVHQMAGRLCDGRCQRNDLRKSSAATLRTWLSSSNLRQP